MIRTLVVALPIVLAVLSACGTNLGGNAGCETDGDCSDGALCMRGECVADDPNAATTCSQDTDCDVNAGEACMGGVCVGQEQVAAVSCDVTADCPTTEYCDVSSYKCIALPTGWCRGDESCGAEAPICLTTSPSAPGRCVECITRDDCGGLECIQPGNCAEPVDETPIGEEPGTGNCGANATETAPDVCVCNDGYVGDGNGHCVLDTGTVEPEPDVGGGETCPANSTLVSGQCQCNTGYTLSPDFSSCVSTGGGGGGGGGGTTGSWTCDPTYYGDGLCDCGCGELDVDCGSLTATCDFDNCATGTANPSNNALCNGSTGGGGTPPTVPAGWTCTASYYSDSSCDCGCGVLDPVCGSASGNAQCEYDSCATGTEPSSTNNTTCVTTGGGGGGTPTVPASWTCTASYYNDTSCDCGCGVLDPVCGSATGNTQCEYDSCATGTEPSSTNNTTCVAVGGGTPTEPEEPTVPAAWTCTDTWYSDTLCDCGCGVADPACSTTVGTEVCDYEECPSGEVTDPANNALCLSDEAPSAWTCTLSWWNDGDCDCGCGVVDVDCPNTNADVCTYDWCPADSELSSTNNAICE
jgi:YHS domain-containing protein